MDHLIQRSKKVKMRTPDMHSSAALPPPPYPLVDTYTHERLAKKCHRQCLSIIPGRISAYGNSHKWTQHTDPRCALFPILRASRQPVRLCIKCTIITNYPIK